MPTVRLVRSSLFSSPPPSLPCPFVLTRCVQRSRSPLAAKHAQQLQERRRLPKFDKPFFSTSLVAYVLGLGMTIGAMHWFEAAQPALLYIWYVWLPSLPRRLYLSRTYYLPGSDYPSSLSFLFLCAAFRCHSPACLLTTVLTAYFKGSWAAMWAWVDESTQEPRDAGANRQPVG